MLSDALDRLRAADPAAHASLSPDRRAELLDEIVCTPAPPATQTRRRMRRRAVLLVGVAALTVTSGSLAVAGVFSGPQTAHEVRADYDRAIKDIPLPSGATLADVTVENDALHAGRRAGYMIALMHADCAWWREWRAGHRVRDAARQAAALAGQAKIVGLMPRAVEGQPEDIGGFTDSVFQQERRMRREAIAGDATTVDQNIHANCTPGVQPGN
jgi:hypothetical protein